MKVPGVSILVSNYNLERYVGAAIESALAQDHPKCEVIVVDDASTDRSLEVIARYSGRIRTVFLDRNGGQLAALCAAWPLARYPILMFLDADDVLMSHAALTVARAWMPATAKIQFVLASMDASGQPLGHFAPKYPPRLETAEIRTELLRTGKAPCSPGSGNAYARWLLDRVAQEGGFVPPSGGVFWMDAILEVNAPFYGEVVTLREPLVYYRMHEGNDSQQLISDVARFKKMTELFEQKLAYITGRCQRWGIDFNPSRTSRDLFYVENRMALARLGNRGPWQALNLLAPSLRACLESPYSTRHKITRGVWLALVATSPRRLARRLIEARFVVPRRPRWIERLIGTARTADPSASATCA